MRLSLAFALALLAISASARPASPRHTSNTSQPLILQADDGEHLVRRSGPTGGWPYLIKLDPQQVARKTSLSWRRSWRLASPSLARITRGFSARNSCP